MSNQPRQCVGCTLTDTRSFICFSLPASVYVNVSITLVIAGWLRFASLIRCFTAPHTASRAIGLPSREAAFHLTA